jgi:predicted nucleic acid-binding protein
MAAFVLDCSVAAIWFFNDETSPIAESTLDALGSQPALVPALFFLEVANVLAAGERRGRLKRSDSDSIIRFFDTLPFQVDARPPNHSIQRVLDLARSHSLTSYDAAYLDLAIHAGLPLATLDEALRKAARKCGVALYGSA